MNFLAHLHLSGNNPRMLLGNFIGDFVKGRSAMLQFEPEIIRGIELHRIIDEFTDTHAIVTQSKKRLRPKYRHYSGVIVDIFYDHFLARNWDKYHAEFLPDFAEKAYTIIQSHQAVLPEEVKFMMPYMIKGNWLVNYARIDGIERALTGMARRTRYESKMEESAADLVTDYDLYQQEFDEFFPALQEHVNTWITKASR